MRCEAVAAVGMVGAAVVAALFVTSLSALAAEPAKQFDAAPPADVAAECARDGRRVQREPAVAFGSTATGGGVYLVVWSDGTRAIDGPTADIYCARVEAGTGRTLDSAGVRVCAAAGVQERPAVAFDGTNFLVAWQDLRGGKDYDVYAARVSPQGKVLDPDGFAVASGTSNQARPAVAFAGGNFVVCWMDAREYPVYGLYAARVAPDGKVLDPAGKAIDAEDPAKIAKLTPPQPSWLGDRHYWWNSLQSRFEPCMASDGTTCLITYLRDRHSNQTDGWAVRVAGADLAVAAPPQQLSCEPKARVAPCRTADGWVVATDHWMSGWSPTPRLAALTLGPAAEPRNAIPRSPDATKGVPPLPAAPMLDLQQVLAGGEKGAGDYQQGKGHFTFWQTACAWDGTQVVVVSDYGWRAKANQTDLRSVVIAARLAADGATFVDEAPVVLATGASASDTCPRRPALAAGPKGEMLAVFEWDAGVDRLTVRASVLRP